MSRPSAPVPAPGGEISPPPARVAVVGAGLVGLSTAWFLQQHGVETVVFDRGAVASGSSWGNAGWLTPSLATPLPEPALLRYGLRAIFDPASPVYLPPSRDPMLLSFLVRFARHCTSARWRTSMAALALLDEGAQQAFDEIEAPELDAVGPVAAPVIAAYRDDRSRRVLVEELRHIEECSGRRVDVELLDGDEARALEPSLSDEIASAIRIDGQRYIDPSRFVGGLAAALTRRGACIRTDTSVPSVDADAHGVRVAGETVDAVVLATGAHLSTLARELGVKRIVQAGRGYSFTVAIDHAPAGPIYLPVQRVACTPVGRRLRLAGMMEFRPPDAPLDQRRIEAIRTSAAPLLRGVDLDDRQDEWVGARPCTADGLPLIGRTRHPRVFVAGGHGMWGITLGPVSGKLLAEQIVTGTTPIALRAVDPLR